MKCAAGTALWSSVLSGLRGFAPQPFWCLHSEFWGQLFPHHSPCFLAQHPAHFLVRAPRKANPGQPALLVPSWWGRSLEESKDTVLNRLDSSLGTYTVQVSISSWSVHFCSRQTWADLQKVKIVCGWNWKVKEKRIKQVARQSLCCSAATYMYVSSVPHPPPLQPDLPLPLPGSNSVSSYDYLIHTFSLVHQI